MKKPIYTNEEQAFDTSLGQKANIQRKHLDETADDKKIAASMNGILMGIGNELNFKAADIDYLGSMATHIYSSKTLGQVFYIHQNCTGDTAEIVASKAFEDLRGTIMQSYKRARPKRRSGF